MTNKYFVLREELKALEEKIKEFSQIENLSERRNLLCKEVSIPLLKIRARFEPIPYITTKIDYVANLCKEQKDTIFKILDAEAKAEHGPLTTVRFNDALYIAEDRDAIKANAVLLRRHYDNLENAQYLEV
jgi:hypothetical protein